MLEDLLPQFKHLPALGWNLFLAGVAILTGFLFQGIVHILLKLYAKINLNYSLFKSVLNRLNTPLTWFLPLITLNFTVDLMRLTRSEYTVIDKIIGISLIVTFSRVMVAVVKIFEDSIYHVYDLNKADNLRERKIRTQIQFIRKLVISLIVILAIGAILFSFKSLRSIGTGLLTGVGI